MKKFVDSYTETSWKHVVSSIIDLIGVVRQTEKASQNFMPKNAENTNQWTSRDVEALASKLETLPIFIDAAHSSSVMNGPVAGQTRCSLPNDHLAYLITWYVFSWKYGRSISIRDHSSITSSKRWVSGVRKWQFLMIYSTVNHQRGEWVGLKKSKTWWRNTWMPPYLVFTTNALDEISPIVIGLICFGCPDHGADLECAKNNLTLICLLFM